MKVALELGDTGETVEVDLPAVPRVGEQILWADEITDDLGTWERLRDYCVGMVSWALSTKDAPFVMLRLDPVDDDSVGPVRPDEEPTAETRCPAVHHDDRRCELNAGHEGLHKNNDFFGLSWWSPDEEPTP
jgi:hypothetical protein